MHDMIFLRFCVNRKLSQIDNKKQSFLILFSIYRVYQIILSINMESFFKSNGMKTNQQSFFMLSMQWRLERVALGQPEIAGMEFGDVDCTEKQKRVFTISHAMILYFLSSV